MEQVNLDAGFAAMKGACAQIEAAGDDQDALGQAALAFAINAANTITGALLDLARSARESRDALVTIARAQEGMLQVALTDVNEIIKETIEKGVDEGVKDAINKRSFIGRVPD